MLGCDVLPRFPSYGRCWPRFWFTLSRGFITYHPCNLSDNHEVVKAIACRDMNYQGSNTRKNKRRKGKEKEKKEMEKERERRRPSSHHKTYIAQSPCKPRISSIPPPEYKVNSTNKRERIRKEKMERVGREDTGDAWLSPAPDDRRPMQVRPA